MSGRTGPTPAAGYSRKPLARKLGLRPGCRVLTVAAPRDYRRLLGWLPDGVPFSARGTGPYNLVRLFVTARAGLAVRLPALTGRITPAAAVRVSWPKRAAKVPTDLTEDTVRRIALPPGLVDVKVSGVNEIWSGLKLVLRIANRPR